MSYNRRDALMHLAQSFTAAAVLLAGFVPVRAQNFRTRDDRDFSHYRGKRIVSYFTERPHGSIVVDTRKKRLYFVLKGGRAVEYGVGVGRRGFGWNGVARIARKAEWPVWHPPKAMIARELKQNGRRLPQRMKGGIDNPLGARALYLFRNNRDTLYRIHGTNEPHTIGQAVSSGCIRMINEEVIDLYNRVKIGAKVEVI